MFKKSAVFMLLLSCLFSCKQSNKKEVVQEEERPNIIFILTDDQRDNSFAAMGHPWVETPNIDKLLSKSMRFENAYIAEPTCRPSRASLLLGNHERINRNGFSSTFKMTQEQWAESYPVLLQKSGYQTGYVGKWHVNNSKDLDFKKMFDFWEGHNGHGPFYFKETNEDGEDVIVTTNRFKTNSALKFLRQTKKDKPFCLSLCYATPHGSKVYSMTDGNIAMNASEYPRLKNHPIYGGKYRDLDIAYPLQNPENAYDYIPKHVMDQKKGDNGGRSGLYKYDYDPVLNKEHHYRYYQMITEIDQMVGEIIDELKEQKIDKKTIILFGSDHGVLMGEKGMGGKGLLYDLSSKFPCFVYDPKAPEAKAGYSSREIVSSLDITATIMDYAGVEKGRFMTGQSLRPLVTGSALKKPWRKGLFLENIYVGRDTPFQEGYVVDGWKYIRCFKIPHPYKPEHMTQIGNKPVFEMLFNLYEDPEEKNNLAQNEGFSEKLNELRTKCDEDLTSILKVREDYAQHFNILEKDM